MAEGARRDAGKPPAKWLTDAEVDAFLAHLAEEKAIGTYGLQGHRQDPQYRYLATHPRVAGAAAQVMLLPVRLGVRLVQEVLRVPLAMLRVLREA